MKPALPTAEEVRQALHYDPDTGVFTWLPRNVNTRTGRTWDTRYAGKIAGSTDKTKSENFRYLKIGLCRRVHRAHEIAWNYMTGEWPEFGIQHADGNIINNAWSNLQSTEDLDTVRRCKRLCLDCGISIRGRNGRSVRCEECSAKHRSKQQRIHQSQPRAREARKLHMREYNRRPEVIEAQRKWYSSRYQRPEYKALKKAYMKEYQKDYHQRPEVKEAKRLARAKRRAKERSQLGHVSKDIVLRLMQNQRDLCVAPGCGKKIGRSRGDYHLEHIVPIARGELHDDSNLQLLCSFCNWSKGTRSMIEFANKRGFLF